MGQQQLFLLVLTLVIVAVAMVVGLHAFDRNSRQSQIDALVNHCLYVASEAAAWRGKETPFLGGGGSYTDLVGDESAMNRLIMTDRRPPGLLKLVAESDQVLTITAVSSDYSEIGVRVRVEGTKIGTAEIARDGSITLPDGG